MKNIHVLPTDKPSKLFYTVGGVLMFTKFEHYNGINIYITNSEEIKEGDWYLYGIEIIQANGLVGFHPTIINECKKIILTTDQNLIANNVQAIDDEFLEWFVKNPSCEIVDVMTDAFTVKEVYILPLGTRNFKYKITIPKEEPKQETLEEAAEKWLNKNGFNIHNHYDTRPSFIAGAKWQAERMYSEEEVLNILNNYNNNPHSPLTPYHLKEWFEQFKKK